MNSTYRKIATPYLHEGRTIILESSWEVEIARWLSESCIRWTRPKHIPWVDSSGKRRRYFPDFYLPDYGAYLDPKNSYQAQIGEEKLRAVSAMVTLVYGTVPAIKDWCCTNCHGAFPIALTT